MNPADLKTIAESLIFAAGNPISLRRLSEVMGVAQTDIKPVLTLLREEYEASGRGIIFAEVAGGYQLRTAPDTAEYVKVLLQEKPSKLSRAALETLAIIAYRQPITKMEIESVRGVTVDGVLNSLLTRKLVREMGRKDVPGRPWVYGTTPHFLELFGLSDLSSLPPLPDIHEPTLNPLADDALNDTIENALESNESSVTDAGGDPDYYAEDTQSPTVNSTLHALEPNEPDSAPEYELSDESSASAGEALSDLAIQQVPETNENRTAPEPSREVNLSPTAEQAPDSASGQTLQTLEAGEADASTGDGDSTSGREDAPSPASEQALGSSRPETGESGSAPEPNQEAIFSSTVEQAAEPASEQTLQADESNWTETGESGSTPEPGREATLSSTREQAAEPASEHLLQALDADEVAASTDDRDSTSGREEAPSATPAQALESSRSDLAPESRDPDPSREGPGEWGDDNPSGDDSASET